MSWTALLVLCCALGPECRAQEELRLALPASTLPEALAECAKRFDIEYLAVGCTDRREEPFIKATCVEDLLEQVLATYGASGIGFDGLWFIDARPLAEDRWQALSTALPPEVAAAADPGVDSRAQWEAARERLRQLLNEKLGPDPQPPEAGLLVLPFEAPTAEVAAVQAHRVRQALESVQSHLAASGPELQGHIRVDDKGGLYLLSDGSTYKVGDIPREWRRDWLAATEGLARPHMDLHWPPLAVQRRAAPSLVQEVQIELSGTLREFAAVCSQQAAVRVTVPEDQAAVRIDARTRPMPVWMALVALSAATGLDVDLNAQRPEYSFHQGDGLTEALHRTSAPAQRLWHLQRRRMWHCRPLFMWLWVDLSDEQREALRAGQSVDIAALPSPQRWIWRQVILFQREHLIASTLARVEPMVRASALRGVLILDEMARSYAAVRVQQGESIGYPLANEAETRSLLSRATRAGLFMSADRGSISARWSSYGTRGAAPPPHRGGRTERSTLLAAPAAEAAE
jgi:hypothetical protein